MIVVGYESTSRKNLTTSIAKVDPKKVPQAANNSVARLLFGRAAGLQAVQQSAEPGGNITMSIRGRGNPLNQPLPLQLVMHPQPEYETDKPVTISADVYDAKQPTSVTLFVWQQGVKYFMPVPMKHETAYTYAATLPAGNQLPDGCIDYCIVVKYAASW